MAIRFLNRREPTRADELTPIEQAQLRHAGKLYDGEDLPVEARLSRDGDEETSFAGFLEHWTIEDGDDRYDGWLYMVDSGTIFREGTLEVVCEVIQFGFDATDRSRQVWADELEKAYRRVDRPRSAEEEAE